MVPILMYHQVAPDAPAAYAHYTVTPDVFARQMRLLVALRYRSLTLDRLWAARSARAALPTRSVVITFDDGFADAVRHAVPVLQRLGLSATFFIVAGLVGMTSAWTRRRRGIEMRLADRTALRDLADGGFTVGSHALTHRPLARLSEAECRYELRESRRRLEDCLERDVLHLAYPHGSADEIVRTAAAECGYRTACSTIDGRSPATDDLLMLRRIPVTGGDTLLDFACRLTTGRPLGRVVQRVRATMKVSALAR